MAQPVARLVSVNVGLPREITWRGRTVFTGIWKEAVDGPRTVRRLNVDGDGQGDLNGSRRRAPGRVRVSARLVPLLAATQMQRDDFTFGQFGENFTVDGLGDDEVCIGDRYRIGSALFEVTQPRVTCYRVGIRMDEPRMAALLVAHGRPGFYFRVLEEGDVQAGDDVVKIATGPEAMTVADINALLYLAGHHDVEQLRRALRIPALSPGWQASLRALLDEELGGSPGGGNAGLTAQGPPPAWPRLSHAAGRGEAIGEQRRRVPGAGVRRRSAPRPRRDPGQFITLKLKPGPGSLATRAQLFAVRIPERCHATGSASRSNRTAPPATTSAPTSDVGDRLEVGAPRGLFILDDSDAAGRARQRGRRRDADAGDVARAPRPPFDARHLVVARRAEPIRARLRRRDAVAPGRPRARAPSRLVQPAGPDRPRGHRLRRGRAHHPGGARSGRRPDRRRVLPVRTDRVHGRAARGPRRARGCRRTRAHRDLRCAGIDHARSRRRVRCGRRINPKAHRARDRSSRSCGPGSTCAGATGARASSSWPRRATCRCDGRVAPASATPARPVSSTGRSTTPPSHSRRPPTATCSCAARVPPPISSIDL